MRLGAQILDSFSTPDEWVDLVKTPGYGAAYWPLPFDAPDEDVDRYVAAADAAGIVIAEVGAWSNPLARDAAEAEAALEKCRTALAIADRVGARCAVNVAGARSAYWAGPHADNFSEETFDRIVASVQGIIDAVAPTRTHYTLETMPWIAPYDVESYERLIDAIDRERFAVHFDPANLVNDPMKYYGYAELTQRFVDRLGPAIKSCHIRDVLIQDTALPLAMLEARPGAGELDLGAYLAAIDPLDPDMPMLLEHLHDPRDYVAGVAHVRERAQAVGVRFAA